MTPKPALDLEAIARRVGIRTDLNPGIDGMIPLTPNERDALITALRTKEAALQEAVGALEEIKRSPHAGHAFANPTLQQAVDCADNYWREILRCRHVVDYALAAIQEKMT